VHPTATLGGKAKCEVTATPAGLQEPHRRSRVKVDGGYSADRWAFVDDGDGYVLKLISKWAWSPPHALIGGNHLIKEQWAPPPVPI
jgi:hypothetical protein